ncbi:trimeric LpxA-like protein [Aspergillus steynii IBT 23096]|uniref:Trimeric LpxA-like protein n=1 Tax=Aspergillus steynii IBT 23096 TaxID=1392250 RepID=A0A2I2G2J0_9EURO|nr:trimeric LpxA-like protein [Aspergillus steynii IBT 23096]PLB47100.1 trimeric LpxA-like protein [Aspergillus steynii IBT 23096]
MPWDSSLGPVYIALTSSEFPTGVEVLYSHDVGRVTEDKTPLPPPKEDPAEDDALFEQEPWIEPPVRIDYGFNVRVGEGVYINSNCVILDTCPVTIGARTLFGPNVHLYSGTHPLDPELRNGTKGPEMGADVVIGEDCWLGGNVTVLPGVTIGKGAVVGAGSVVTKVVEYWSLG